VSSFEFYGDKGVACLDGLNVGDTARHCVDDADLKRWSHDEIGTQFTYNRRTGAERIAAIAPLLWLLRGEVARRTEALPLSKA